MPVKI